MELICLRALVFCVLVNGKVHNRNVASSFQATSEMELFKVEKLGILSQYIRTSNKEAARWCTRKTKAEILLQNRTKGEPYFPSITNRHETCVYISK